MMVTVIFDLDDTLYDRTQPLRKAFLHFEPANGLSFDKFLSIFTKNSDIAFDRVQAGHWTLAESHIFRIKETLHEMGISISDVQAHAFQTAYKNSQHHIEVHPFIIEILDFLREKKILTLILTNGPSAHQRSKIKSLGLGPYFKHNQIIVSEEEGIVKPDRRIFELAEKRFNFDKKQAWYIGDSYQNDMIGAYNAGWNSIWFHKDSLHKDNPSILPTKTVSSTLELKTLLIDLCK